MTSAPGSPALLPALQRRGGVTIHSDSILVTEVTDRSRHAPAAGAGGRGAEGLAPGRAAGHVVGYDLVLFVTVEPGGRTPWLNDELPVEFAGTWYGPDGDPDGDPEPGVRMRAPFVVASWAPHRRGGMDGWVLGMHLAGTPEKLQYSGR